MANQIKANIKLITFKISFSKVTCHLPTYL